MNTRTDRKILSLAVLAWVLAACSASGEGSASSEGGTVGAAGAAFATTGGDALPAPAPAGDAAFAAMGGMPPQPAQTTAEAPLPASAGSGMQAVQIIDKSGFGQPMVAALAEIPAGWRAEGGIGWDRSTQCVTNQLQFRWRATSPDGSQAFEIMPGYNWQVQGTQIQMNPCPVAPYSSTRDFLQAVVQRVRPGARVLEYRDRPDIAQKAAASAPSNPQVQVRQDSGQMLLAYEANGRQERELFGATVAFMQMQGNIVAGTSTVYAQRAPNGKLDFALSDRIAASLKPNPQWLIAMREGGTRAVSEYSAAQRRQIDEWNARQMAAINAKGMADRAAIRANTARDVAAINAQTNANTQATNDRIHAGNLEAIGEYNTYIGTDGQPLRTSIHAGERVLQMDNGTVISTDDPYYDPAGSTELERRR